MIRKAIINDLTDINDLGSKLHKNFEITYHMETEINNINSIVLVHEEKNRINGYLYAIKTIDNIDILSIFVDEKYRKKNIGLNLMLELINNNRFHEETIMLEVSTDNTPAINLYKKVGFQIINVRKNYYENKDAYVMKWG